MGNNYVSDLIAKHCGEARRVVDFGAGIGSFAKRLRDGSREITCIETDDELLLKLKADGFQAHHSLNEFPDEAQDYIYTLSVLEHIEHDEEVMRLFFKKLRAGGKAFIFLPAGRVLFGAMDRQVEHYRRYELRDLSHKLESIGFEIVDSGYFDFFGFFIMLLYKLLGFKNGLLSEKSVRLYDKIVFPLNRGLNLLVNRKLGKNLFVVAKKPVI